MRRQDSGEENKKVKNARKVTYKGIKFKSALELFTYKKLEENKIKVDYEKHKFILLEGFKPNNEVYSKIKEKNGYVFSLKTRPIRPITYTPDFVKLNSKKEGFIIETKGYKTEEFNLKWKLFMKHLDINNYKVKLFVPRNQKNVLDMINILKNE